MERESHLWKIMNIIYWSEFVVFISGTFLCTAIEYSNVKIIHDDVLMAIRLDIFNIIVEY